MSPQGVRPTDQQLLGSGDQPKLAEGTQGGHHTQQNTTQQRNQQTKTPKTPISICVLQGSSAHRPFRACASRPAPTVPTPHAQTFVTVGWLVSCFLPGGESSSFASSTPGCTVVAQSARRGASLEADCVEPTLRPRLTRKNNVAYHGALSSTQVLQSAGVGKRLLVSYVHLSAGRSKEGN